MTTPKNEFSPNSTSELGLLTFLTVSAASLTLLVARGWNSLDRIPADPGYGWIVRASSDGFFSVFSLDPFMHAYELVVVWMVAQLPVAFHAAALSVLTHLTWAAGSGLVVLMIRNLSRSAIAALISGLVTVLLPHTSESVLGNNGNSRWILLIVLVVAVSVGPESQPGKWITPLLALVTGLSHPLAGVSLIPIFGRFLSRRKLCRTDLRVFALLGLGVAMQLFRAIEGNFWQGHSYKIMFPWDGMGVFWWSGLAGPVLVSLGTLLVLNSCSHQRRQYISAIRWLSTLALIIHGVSFLMGGIADRYFVAPLTLSLIAALLTLFVRFESSQFSRRWLVLVYLLTFAFPAGKWFSASWFLTSGPTWSSEVRRATAECEDTQSLLMTLRVSPSGSEELTCEYLLDGD